jgi:hypothetical protein
MIATDLTIERQETWDNQLATCWGTTYKRSGLSASSVTKDDSMEPTKT